MIETASVEDQRPPPLEVRDLRVAFPTESRQIEVVSGVTFELERNKTTGLVGESGSGKTMTALALMGLLQRAGAHVAGTVLLNGTDITAFTDRQMANLRGAEIAMIFQEPRTSFNPAFTVGDQIAETIRRHRSVKRSEARACTVDLLALVGIPNPKSRADEYPHMFSGGMLQRAMLAMAISCEPSVLIADEPTTALDVTIQAQILDLMRDLQSRLDTAILLVTHDMGVVADFCDNVAVMYAGQIIEVGDAERLFVGPLHPYTEGLLAAVPRLDRKTDRLVGIDGTIPDPSQYPEGCRFADRCGYVDAVVCREPQVLRPLLGRSVRCALSEQIPLRGVSG